LMHAIQHAPAELGRDSSSMLLGTSLLWGLHCGSYCDHDNCGSGGRYNQRIWTSQQLLGASLLGSPPFISNPKNLEALMSLMMPFIQGILFGMHLLNSQETGSILLCASLLWGSDCGSYHDQDSGSDSTAPCSPNNHNKGNDSMTYVEWDPECKCSIHSLLPPFCNLWTMSNNYILLWLSVSDSLDY
jgi:hypothetical protein